MFGSLKEHDYSRARAIEKKERIGSIRCIDKETEEAVMSADFYMGRARTAESVYCRLHVKTPSGYTYGTAAAHGAGYCKRSAAFDMACRDANIDIAGMCISGAGMEKVKKAALEICKAAGYSNIIYLEI